MVSKDKDRNLVAAIAYFGFFITGIVVLLVEKNNKFIRFHAMQSTIIFGGLFLLNMIISLIFSPVSFLGILVNLINFLIWAAWMIIWLVSMIRAYRGEVFKWPIAGDLAERRIG